MAHKMFLVPLRAFSKAANNKSQEGDKNLRRKAAIKRLMFDKIVPKMRRGTVVLFKVTTEYLRKRTRSHSFPLMSLQ